MTTNSKGAERKQLRCASCQAVIASDAASIDYIVPRAKGGTGVPSNLQLLCSACNRLKAAQALSSASNIGGLLANVWLRAFKESPTITSVATALVTIVAAVAAVLDKPQDNASINHAPTFAEQEKMLDETQASLQRLSRFVAEQQSKTRAEQNALADLQAQRRSLEPLVAADKRVVESLLLLQQDRAERSAARERWIGFGLGVVSSIVASAVLAAAGMLMRRGTIRTKVGE